MSKVAFRLRSRPLVVASLVALLLVGSLATQATALGPGGWDHLGDGATAGTPSLNGAVYALNREDPGVLFVGGNFENAGGLPAADRIARWNGTAWGALDSSGSGISNGSVNAIAYAAGRVFVGGTFINAGGNADADFLAEWDGNSWTPVCNSSGPPITATVNALQIIGNTLYVAGAFEDGAEIESADRLVACDITTGAASSTVVDAAHEFGGTIYALTADSNGTLYAGGGFTDFNKEPAADNVAYLDGTGWHAMGAGAGACSCAVDDFVRSLTAAGTNVYVGTDAKDVAGIAQADHVARWDGSAWSALGSNTAGTDGWFPDSAFINGLTPRGSYVYATGSFQNANGDPTADFIAYFDGIAWHALGSDGAGNGPWSGNGLAITSMNARIFAGGNFTSAGGDTQARSIACYQLSTVPCTPKPPPPPPPPPPPATVPSSNFTISARASCSGSCNILKVEMTFESAGDLVAEDAGSPAARAALANRKSTASLVKKLHRAVSAGPNSLKLKLTAAGQQKLKKAGSLHIKVRFTFTPSGGTARSQVRNLTAKSPGKKHQRH